MCTYPETPSSSQLEFFFSWRWGGCSTQGWMPTYVSILRIPRWYEFGERRWKDILTGENRRTRSKTCPSATLSTTNFTWIDPGANPGLRGERPQLELRLCSVLSDECRKTIAVRFLLQSIKHYHPSCHLCYDRVNDCLSDAQANLMLAMRTLPRSQVRTTAVVRTQCRCRTSISYLQ
jgi:hypothetical protein